MAVIENFNELSEQERLQFAEQLLAKINADNVFLPGYKFEVLELYSDELTGDLTIEVDTDEGLVIAREASWEAGSRDDVRNPESSNIYFENDVITDIKVEFKNMSTIIDGYKVTVDIYDYDEDHMDDVEVDHTSKRKEYFDYEYWGTPGSESWVSYKCRGTIYYTYSVGIALIVEPATETE